MCYSRPSSGGVVFAAAAVLFAFFKHRTFTVPMMMEKKSTNHGGVICRFALFWILRALWYRAAEGIRYVSVERHLVERVMRFGKKNSKSLPLWSGGPADVMDASSNRNCSQLGAKA